MDDVEKEGVCESLLVVTGSQDDKQRIVHRFQCERKVQHLGNHLNGSQEWYSLDRVIEGRG